MHAPMFIMYIRALPAKQKCFHRINVSQNNPEEKSFKNSKQKCKDQSYPIGRVCERTSWEQSKKLFTFADISQWQAFYTENWNLCLDSKKQWGILAKINIHKNKTQITNFWTINLFWAASKTLKITVHCSFFVENVFKKLGTSLVKLVEGLGVNLQIVHKVKCP